MQSLNPRNHPIAIWVPLEWSHASRLPSGISVRVPFYEVTVIHCTYRKFAIFILAMTPPIETVFQPHLLSTEMVHIGALMPKPLQPTVNPLIPDPPVSGYTDARTDEPYITFVSHKRGGGFTAAFSKFFTGFVSADSVIGFKVQAAKARWPELKNSDETFRKLCQKKSTRVWINDMIRYRKPIYFIVGLQVVKDAVFTQVIRRTGKGGIEAVIPLESVEIPVDAKVQAQLYKEGHSYVGFKTVGEAVMGIEVREVLYNFKRSVEEILQDEVKWVYPSLIEKGGEKGKTDRFVGLRLGRYVSEDMLQEEVLSDDEEV